MVVRLSALRNRPPLPPENAPGTHFCQRLSRPQGHSAIGRILCRWKIPKTPAGIEPATFRFVAQHLNHCATAVPGMHFMDRINKNIYRNILWQMDDGKHKKEEEPQNLKLKNKSFIQAEQCPVSTNTSFHDSMNSLARWQERSFFF